MSGLALMLMLGGCSSDKAPTASVNPAACFTMTVTPSDSIFCPLDLLYVLDATCSTDDVTPTESLQVRWDIDGDGVWDSQWDTDKINSWHLPDADDSTWTAICEVRDADGNTSLAKQRIEVSPIPDTANIIATAVFFVLSGVTPVDTVYVGQNFALVGMFGCFGGLNGRTWDMLFLRDGAPVDTLESECRWACGGFGRPNWHIDTAGEYVFRVILDFRNEVREADETDNSVAATLVVIP